MTDTVNPLLEDFLPQKLTDFITLLESSSRLPFLELLTDPLYKYLYLAALEDLLASFVFTAYA
jgi:hypothetical protein